MGTLGVSGGAGARRVVETVFTKGLRISRAAEDDTATHKAENGTDPARVQGVAKAHDGGLLVGAHREPDGGNNGAESWGDMEKAVSEHTHRILSAVGRIHLPPHTCLWLPTNSRKLHTHSSATP